MYMYMHLLITTQSNRSLYTRTVHVVPVHVQSCKWFVLLHVWWCTLQPGAIDRFLGDTQKVIELVAKDTEEKGLFEDAVKLYDLAKVRHQPSLLCYWLMEHVICWRKLWYWYWLQDCEKVLELLNKLLTQVLSEAPTPHSAKDRIKQLAVSIAQRSVRGQCQGQHMKVWL